MAEDMRPSAPSARQTPLDTEAGRQRKTEPTKATAHTPGNKQRAGKHQPEGQSEAEPRSAHYKKLDCKLAHGLAKKRETKKETPHTKAPARERGIAWGACDKAASFGIANSFIVAPGPKKRNL